MIAVVAAGGSGDVDEALLQRVAQILGGSSGGSSGFSGGFSSGGSSSFGGGYSAPSSSYGAPQGRSSGGGRVRLESPQRAQQIANFDLGGGFQRSQGGYSAPQQSYSAPQQSYNAPQRSFGGRLRLESPQRAQQVAEFDLGGGSRGFGGGSYSAPARNGGPY